MRKRIVLLYSIILVCFLFGACQCEHEWVDATCATPKMCTKCNETEGKPLGHSWIEADCTIAKRCSVCRIKEGDPAPHNWKEADCVFPKRCTECGATEGSAFGHSWIDATCTTPKTCSVCGATVGGSAGHELIDASCTADSVCVTCGKEITAPGHNYLPATCTAPQKCTVCGEEAGKPLGHSTTSGICSNCGEEIYDTVTGKGDDVIDGIFVGEGIYRVHFTHSGNSNFVVRMYDANDVRSLLINEIGKYDGSVLLMGDTPYCLEIKASGKWSYKIEKLTTTDDPCFSGKGDYVTNLFSGTTGTWHIKHTGKSNFVIRVYTTDGRELLVNEIGSYDGKVRVNIPEGSYAILEVTADGAWTIEPASYSDRTSSNVDEDDFASRIRAYVTRFNEACSNEGNFCDIEPIDTNNINGYFDSLGEYRYPIEDWITLIIYPPDSEYDTDKVSIRFDPSGQKGAWILKMFTVMDYALESAYPEATSEEIQAVFSYYEDALYDGGWNWPSIGGKGIYRSGDIRCELYRAVNSLVFKVTGN